MMSVTVLKNNFVTVENRPHGFWIESPSNIVSCYCAQLIHVIVKAGVDDILAQKIVAAIGIILMQGKMMSLKDVSL